MAKTIRSGAMNYGEHKSAPSDFRVHTRIYPQGRPLEVESVVPLHPKVRAYLEHRADFLHFEIYDWVSRSFVGYNMQHIFSRKIYYVPYHLADHQPMVLGAGTVMIFDQVTGELLYKGDDGCE